MHVSKAVEAALFKSIKGNHSVKRVMLAKKLWRHKQLLEKFRWVFRAMSDESKLFDTSSIADAYVKYRPTYGPDVYDTIVKFCKETESCDFSLAVDVGCGSGQSTLPLTKHFHKVIGLDVSEAQIARAPKHFPNLSFRVGPAEDLSFMESGCVDLVTVAQAMHWMDVKLLFPEVERVLKPGGAFVVYGYGLTSVDEPKAEETLRYVRTVLHNKALGGGGHTLTGIKDCVCVCV